MPIPAQDKINEEGIRTRLQKVCGYSELKKACPATLINEILAMLPKKYNLHLLPQDINEGRNCLIGVGGQGIVVCCYNEKDQKVAVKIVKPAFNRNVIQKSDKVNDFIYVPVIPEQRFIESAKLQCYLEEEAVKVPRSFMIPRVYAVEDKPVPFFIMKWVEGIDVFTLFREKNSIVYALEMFLKVLDVAEFLHENNIVYRDFKSQNFLVSYEDKIVLLDFGLAKEIELRNLTLSGTALGTLPYASLRMLRNSEAANQVDDVFALGYVLWEFVMGKETPPYQGAIHDTAYKESYRLNVGKLLPDFIKGIFFNATAINEDRSYKSVPEFRFAIATLVNRYKFNSRGQDYRCTEILDRQQDIKIPDKVQYVAPLQPPKNNFRPASFSEYEKQAYVEETHVEEAHVEETKIKESTVQAEQPYDTLSEANMFLEKLNTYKNKVMSVDCQATCKFPLCMGRGICKHFICAVVDIFNDVFLKNTHM